VGALQTRKNLARLVEAFAATPRGWKLLLAGGDGYGAAEVHAAIARSPRRADIATPGYVPLAGLEQAYARASIFAFPSLDEGFGIPVLEAMAWGVPVLTSNRAALPEAAGGAALLVNPTDATELADALRNLCLDEDKRQRMREAGLGRVLQATWHQTVAATWRAYQAIG
jgi:glycosyltransferase involved in cell wall biosynthesis